MSETEKIIDALVREICEIAEDDADYDVDLNLFDAGYLDSLGSADLLAGVEERFGVTIGQKDIILYPMNTVREIAAVVDGKLGG